MYENNPARETSIPSLKLSQFMAPYLPNPKLTPDEEIELELEDLVTEIIQAAKLELANE